MTIDVNNLKVNDFVWWSANRNCKSWDTPGIITKIEPDTKFGPHITVRTFDDDKETRLSTQSDSFTKEMKICDILDVNRFLSSKILSAKKALLDKEFEVSVAAQRVEDLEARRKQIVDDFALRNQNGN